MPFFYDMHDQWIDGERYRCPRCAEEYWPWKYATKNSKGNIVFEYLPYQKVIVIDGADGNTWVFPAEWPGSQADTWLLQQAAIYAAQIQIEGDLERYMDDTVTGLMKLCERVGFPVSFNHYDWDPEVEYRLDSAKWPCEGEKGWGRLSAKGYWGNIMPVPKDNKWQVFTEWHELIQLIGRATYCRAKLSIAKAEV